MEGPLKDSETNVCVFMCVLTEVGGMRRGCLGENGNGINRADLKGLANPTESK